MNELEKLITRLKNCKSFHVTPGPKWNNLTSEERAKVINHSLDSGTKIDNIDKPPMSGKKKTKI